MGKLSPILQERHDRALRNFKASNKSWQQEHIEADAGRKTEHQKTHERFNPGGAAILDSLKRRGE